MQDFKKLFYLSLAALVIISISEIAGYPNLNEPSGDNSQAASPNVTNSTDIDCPGVPKSYYDELDCKPVFKNPEDRCPVRYTCENFEEADIEMCYFRGKTIAPGTTLNDTGNPCDVDCTCTLQEPSPGFNVSKMAVFRCAVIDCPLEEQSSYDENGELLKCVPKKSHDECCASETVCIDDADDDDDNNSNETRSVTDMKNTDSKNSTEPEPKRLAKCVTADNKTYVEGQEFYLEDQPCKVCICQPGYTAGESGEPWCREVRCGSVLEHTRQIREGCVPVYYNTSRCCPIAFHCPDENDKVISKVPTKIAPKPDESCRFGENILKIDDELAPRPTEKCIECECKVPPFLICHMKADC